MDSFRADFRQLDYSDIPQMAVPVSSSAGRRTLNQQENSLLVSSLELGSVFDARLKTLLVPFAVATRPPAVTILLPGLSPMSALTVAIGPGVDVFPIGLGYTVQGGVWGSKTVHAAGLFWSYGPGIWFNVGASVGVTLSFIFGPPADMDGVSYAVGADIGTSPGLGFSGTLMLLFTPPPFRILGFSVGASWGWGASPVDVTLQKTTTGRYTF